MAEERIYTIIVQRERVEVSREVYYAYHKARDSADRDVAGTVPGRRGERGIPCGPFGSGNRGGDDPGRR